MATNEYHFITHWRVAGTVDEVATILDDPLGLPRWWPSVYLRVAEIQPGDARGVGRVIGLHTKGWLPYTLRWSFRVVDSRYPRGFMIEARSDFEGRGIWALEQHGDVVDVTYDWKIAAEKPLLRRLSFVLKPIFAANHRWAMARGEESFRLDLAHRRARTLAERSQIAAPPRPTSIPHGSLVASAAVIAGALLLDPRQRVRRDDGRTAQRDLRHHLGASPRVGRAASRCEHHSRSDHEQDLDGCGR